MLGELGASVHLGRVAAIGVCSQVNTHVSVGPGGEPLSPAIVWQDTRCAAVAAELERSSGGAVRVDASSWLARAEWLRRERPDEWGRTRRLLLPKDYVNLRLCGETATDAISSIGLVDDAGSYLEDVFELVPEARRLAPPLRPPTHPLGGVRAEATGLPSTAAVVVATMDAWGNLYGSGVVEPGAAMEVAGTSEIVGVLSRRAVPTPGIVTFPPVDGLYLHAGPTQAGGDALRWLAEAHGLSLEQTLGEAAGIEAGSGGLVFLPHLLGERAPLWDPDARGVFFGLSFDHGRAHLARAVLEGVAFSARHLLEAAEGAAGLRVAALNASGGGARSELWCQIKADALGRQIRRLEVLESGVLGAALIAGVGASLLPSLSAASASYARVEHVFEPDASCAALYDELYAVYRGLDPALAVSYGALAAYRARRAAATKARTRS